MKKIFPILFFIVSCQTAIKKEVMLIKEPIEISTTTTKPTIAIIKLKENEYPVFKDTGEIKKFLKAAEFNIIYLRTLSDKKNLYSFGDRKITNELLLKTTQKLVEILSSSDASKNLDALIKENFDIYELKPDTNSVVFSSYYEPIIEASLKPTKEYKYPIYAKPPDLIEVNLEDFNEKYKGEKITGRIVDGKLVPYFSRDEIDYQKILEGKNLELAWFKSMADIMDLHIEGSGILKLPDGKYIKAKFAATNSLKFKGWMTALLEMGLMKKDPDLQRAILGQNKRYTFFKLEEIKDPDEGPTGTYGYPLVGGRSIAVDRTLIPMGMPAFIIVPLPDVSKEGKLYGIKDDSRFVFCQDTGGAIKGGRVDFFAGNGTQAKTFSFSLWEKGRLLFLLSKESGDKI